MMTYSADNQKMVIYSLLTWQVTRKEILNKVNSDDFVSPYNQYFDEVSKAIADNTIDNQDFKIDYMGKRQDLLTVKGSDWKKSLNEMINDGVRRKLRLTTMLVSGMIEDPAVPMSEINEQLSKLKILSEDSRLYTKPVRTSKDLMISTMDRLEEIAKGEQTYNSFGIDSLDEICQSTSGDFNVIAARTAVGKSLVAHNMLLGAAIKQKVGYWVNELSEDGVGMRMVAAESGVPLNKLKNRDLSHGDTKSMLDSVKSITALQDNLFISTGENLKGDTVEDIIRWIEKLAKTHGVKHFFLDYLQRIKATNDRVQRREQVSHIVYSLKTCAQNLGITITALAQLNRSAVGERPGIHHLAESAYTEQEASIIILLDRLDAGESAKQRGYKTRKEGTESGLRDIESHELKDKMIFLISKNRNGAKKILYHDVDMPTLKIGDESIFTKYQNPR